MEIKKAFETKLSDLLNQAKKGEIRKKNHFKNLTFNRNKIIVYGFGSGFTPLYNSVLSRFNLKPEFIIDKKFNTLSQKKNLKKTNFLGSNELASIKNKEEYAVIVSLGSKKKFELIFKKLKGQGFDIIVWGPDIFEYNIHHLDGSFDKNPKLFFKSRQDIINSFNLLKDNKSRSIFLDILEVYVTHTPSKIDSDDIKKQYFDLKLFKKNDYQNYINCGAYTGDSVKNLTMNIGKINSLICIEPDQKNFESLSVYCIDNSNKIAKSIYLYPLALADNSSLISFSSNLGLCSEIDLKNSSRNLIQTTKLDSLVSSESKYFISMDLEGYEKNAIKGMERIIKEGKSNLAISIYHRVSDLWTIISQISDLNKKYNFYIRNYTGFTYETVLYCKLK